MRKLLLNPTYKPDVSILGRPRLLHHAVAPISRKTASASQVVLDPSDPPELHVPMISAVASKVVRPQHLLRSAASTLRTTASASQVVSDPLDLPTLCVPMISGVASKLVRPRNHLRSAAPTLRTTASASQVVSDPSVLPKLRVPTISAVASKSVRPQHHLRSTAPNLHTTASVNHLALDQLGLVKLGNSPSLLPRQPSTAKDVSLTSLGRIIENRAVLKLFATESAKYHACVEIAEMLHMVSRSVFQTVLKQLPNFCVALNSLTTEYAKPLAFIDAMSGGGPHSKPWRDHEKLEDWQKGSMIDMVNPPPLFQFLKTWLLFIISQTFFLGHS